MNITPFLIYVWQLADGIKAIFVFMSIVLIFATVFFWVENKRGKILLSALLIIFSIVAAGIPSSRTIAMMYVLPKVQQIIPSTETMSKEASDVYAMLKDYLAKELKEK